MPVEFRSGAWRVLARYRGYPYFSLTLRHLKTEATDYDATLKSLHAHQRLDVFKALAEKQVELPEVHRAVAKSGAASLDLDKLGVRSRELTLGGLYNEWRTHMESAGAFAPRTRRAYAPATLERYRQGWDNFFRHHPKGRLANPSTLTTAALDAFRSLRIKSDHVSDASANRDLTAIQSFLRWVRHHRPYAMSRPPRVDKLLERDYSKDARHLEPEQWAALCTKLPDY
jgi:hypothetical protein